MAPTGYFIDSNLLVLCVAGDVNRRIIGRHRRLSRYSVDDYDRLRAMLASVRHTYVTPNTLTETSNLLAQHREPERTDLLRGLQWLIHQSKEVVIASAQAAQSDSYVRLGLADAALLETISAETPVITVDLGLYLEALRKDPEAAVNFEHVRGA